MGGVPLRQVEVIGEVSGTPPLRLGPLARRALQKKARRSVILNLSQARSAAVAMVLVH